MKLKHVMAACAVLGYATAAHAQSAGDFMVSTGWLRFMPRDSSDPLRMTIPGFFDETLPGSGAGVSSADTLGVAGSYFITDNISSELVIGVPPRFDISGTGTLAAFGKVGQVRQWSPTLLLKYHLFDAQAQFRPYVGVGVSRIWFKNARITNPDFENAISAGDAPIDISVKNRWAAVFNVGATYRIDQHWFAGLSVSYMPLSTEATLQTSRVIGPGRSVQETVKTSVKVNPIITYLNIGYRF